MAPDRELTYVDLPAQVGRVLRTLGDAGHEAALVGGVVRDRLAGESMPRLGRLGRRNLGTTRGGRRALRRCHVGEPLRHGDHPW